MRSVCDSETRLEHEILTCYQVQYDGSKHFTLQNVLCSNCYFPCKFLHSLGCPQFKGLTPLNLDKHSLEKKD